MPSYIKVQNRGANAVTLNLPVISQLEDEYQVTLFDQSTYIYGYQNRFVMDLGTKRAFTVTCERDNPRDYNDSSRDPDDWSNGKWYLYLEKLLDPWQNLMEPDGGFVFHFEAPDKELMMNITKNVFLNGSISPTFGVQKLTFTLPLVVARMNGTDKRLNTVAITLRANLNSESTIQNVPEDVMTVVPSCPASWTAIDPTTTFAYWSTSSSDNGTRYYPGAVWSPSSNITLYAIWRNSVQDEILDTAGSKAITIDRRATRCVAYVIGAGGGAGGAGHLSIPQGVSTNDFYFAGGAGAGGEMIVMGFEVTGGETMTLIVGTGGVGGETDIRKGSDGEDGGASSVTYGPRTITANGGRGGKGRTASILPPPAKGGSEYYPGGDSGQPGTTEFRDGVEGHPGNAGPAGTVDLGTVHVSYADGAGGGCPPLDHVVNKSGTRYTARGGDGRGNDDVDNGQYGGGGGSSSYVPGPMKKTGGNGGDGLIFIRFYE